MQSLTQSITITLLYSLWQSAVLFLLYRFILLFNSPLHPLAKRNALLALTGSQVIISIITFVLCRVNSGSSNLWFSFEQLNNGYLQNILPAKLPAYLLWLYAAGILYKAGRLLWAWYNFYRFRFKNHIKAPAHFRYFATTIAQRMGIRRKVTIWLSEQVCSPLTYGFLKPVILLPVTLLNQLSEEQAESIILHELVHIRQHDYFINCLLLLAETVFFFNPIICRAVKQLRQQRELACDLAVLEFNYHPLTYADALLKLARVQQISLAFEMAAIQKKEFLLERIKMFTGEIPGLRKKNVTIFFMIIPLFFALIQGLILSPGILQTNAKEPYKRKKIVLAPSDEPTLVRFSGNTVEPVYPQVEAEPLALPLEPVKEFSSETQSLAKHPHSVQPAEQAADDAPDAGYVYGNETALVPVAWEPAADSAREIIITEETSGGNSITKSYKLSRKHGKWKVTLLWIAEDRKAADSVPAVLNRDSSGAE